ncbi:UNVERIFIED_CONTAM: CRM-domain containing factor CFM3, chloroplastic/mitochondrial [Sesamum angustifolium]|uniref:CRM-domain containing factor CFM3, chloroplastic/mitochondrial n=1 Tax=Sesamum angustifolium TaxID=2727405 RepID=A0AAW2IPH3_9LAMI
MEKMMRDAAVARHASMVGALRRKLAIAKSKIGKAEKALQKVLQNQEPESLPTDLETLTDEERFLFRRIGLSMKPYLLLGRREVFDGTIENMHLHWKYRELVKIIVERKTFAQVKHIAVSLEAESGGLLVSVDRTTKGYAIIVYRGKNYQRPLAFRPRNLLTKRQALARSIELQRREALKHHILELEENLEKLKQELEEMVTANNNGGEALASRTDAAASDCNDDEDEETFLRCSLDFLVADRRTVTRVPKDESLWYKINTFVWQGDKKKTWNKMYMRLHAQNEDTFLCILTGLVLGKQEHFVKSSNASMLWAIRTGTLNVLALHNF